MIEGSSPPEKKTDDTLQKRQKQYHTHYAPMTIEIWAPSLFKSVGLVPKFS